MGLNDVNSLGELLSKTAAAAGDNVAVKSGDARITWAELLEQATSLSNRLRAGGVAQGERVAVILPNCCEFMIAVCAVWVAGAIVVPIDPKAPREELVRLIGNCETRVLLSDRRLTAVIGEVARDDGTDVRWVFESEVGSLRFVAENEPGGDPAAVAAPVLDHDSPALTQFSSGSSGVPKRVTRTHGNLLAEAFNVGGVLGLSQDDRLLAAVPLHHAYGFGNVLQTALAFGATIVTCDGFFPADVVRLISDQGVTGAPLVPFMVKMLAETPAQGDFSLLRYCTSTAQKLPVEQAEAFRNHFGVFVSQLYGSTETGVVATNVGSKEALETCGVPAPGVTVEIRDEDGAVCPAGVEGYICVHSVTAARRYDQAVPVEEGGSRFEDGWFIPSDLGVLREDGRLEIHGRKRMFINVAGNKVDPGEVEKVLRAHPSVKDVAVIGIPDGSTGERVKAVVVAPGCGRSELLEYCRENLLEYKRPRVLELRKQIPRNPLGKILRKFLVEEETA